MDIELAFLTVQTLIYQLFVTPSVTRIDLLISPPPNEKTLTGDKFPTPPSPSLITLHHDHGAFLFVSSLTASTFLVH